MQKRGFLLFVALAAYPALAGAQISDSDAMARKDRIARAYDWDSLDKPIPR